jgi:hypothetical protein
VIEQETTQINEEQTGNQSRLQVCSGGIRELMERSALKNW